MGSSASRQYAGNAVFWLATRASRMEWYCLPGTAHFVPSNKISPKLKQVHKSFLLPKLFSAEVKNFFVISLSLWNQKKRQHLSNQDIGARAITLAFNWVPFQCSKINKYEDHFLQCSLCHIINLLLTKLVRSRWLGIGLVLFLRLYGPRLRLGP